MKMLVAGILVVSLLLLLAVVIKKKMGDRMADGIRIPSGPFGACHIHFKFLRSGAGGIHSVESDDD
ncbi:hypothetical protein [Paenibacillus sp. DMB20]|uniref:hypothetical protein n=1 Tax=Paenibacillus sp. DMB20 TaxID=1642570 RepID=UPI0006281787|nr:hypothetical protein XI25_19035 [Paenibacillus sp. DMB20]